MPTVNIEKRKITAAGILQVVSVDYRVSQNSLRTPDGRLKLRSNPHTRWQSTLVTDTYNGRDRRSHPWGSRPLYPDRYALDWASLESRSYAKFRRKLYQGSASLGVTLGSYKQSREMIVKRFNTLRSFATSVLSRRTIQDALRAGRKLSPRDASSLHLEVVFGWVPLLEDIHKAATTVIQTAPAYEWVKSSARSNQTFSKFVSNNYGEGKTFAEFNVKHTRGAEVVVSNPNVWLAERAGLLNPVSVAWDIVPWSFVVNMFLNTGQLVNTITDFAGLDILNGYTTKSARGVASWSVEKWDKYPSEFPGRLLYYTCNEKYTELNPVSRPRLQFKVPNANWELAAIAASLFTQKASGIFGLINLNHFTGRR